ncbi:MAG: GDYXXLXY domain-containing protein [Halobacteriales archaeon]|nr:GDYXXLXY domain-containing protein [Halobacteriales archaeon]
MDLENLNVDLRLVVLLGVPALVVGGFLVWQYWTVLTGEEVVLEVVEPVDPRDVFRGQYAVLEYSITTLNLTMLPSDVEEGDTVYVTLEEEGEYWVAVDASTRTPDATCIRGEVESVRGDTARVSYGIENFFAEPEEARRIEEERWRNDVAGIVAVDSRCGSVLRGVRIGNETLRSTG